MYLSKNGYIDYKDFTLELFGYQMRQAVIVFDPSWMKAR